MLQSSAVYDLWMLICTISFMVYASLSDGWARDTTLAIKTSPEPTLARGMLSFLATEVLVRKQYSAGVAYWLQQPSPASSRRPTARQVEASARWPGLRTHRKHTQPWGLHLPDSGPSALTDLTSCVGAPSWAGFRPGRQKAFLSVQYPELEKQRG